MNKERRKDRQTKYGSCKCVNEERGEVLKNTSYTSFSLRLRKKRGKPRKEDKSACEEVRGKKTKSENLKTSSGEEDKKKKISEEIREDEKR